MKKNVTNGFSLVEILVAAVIVTLSLVSVVAFVRKGQEQVIIDKHRRVARSIVERAIEDPAFDMINYPNLVTKDSLRTALDIIDNKMTPQLTGNMNIKIGAEAFNSATTGTVAVPYRKITVTITWNELNNPVAETVSTEKLVTNGVTE